MIQYQINKISNAIGKEYIKKHHYSKGCSNAPTICYGLFDNDNLIGVIMFANPCSESVRSCVFGEKYKSSVIELHRLHILDVTPRNTESWFISRALKMLKKDLPQIKAVITYADMSEGHKGTIYKATNAYAIGKTTARTFYIDENGRLRHPRQNGKNITKEAAQKLNWKPVKR